MDETGYIPKSLEAQERFMWWDFDQAILFLLLMGMGVISGAMLAGMVFGGLVTGPSCRRKSLLLLHPMLARGSRCGWSAAILPHRPMRCFLNRGVRIHPQAGRGTDGMV